MTRVRSPEEESAVCAALAELLEREGPSEVFLEGISYALFKVAERGLLGAAQVLLRYGADLNFEGEVSGTKRNGSETRVHGADRRGSSGSRRSLSVTPAVS